MFFILLLSLIIHKNNKPFIAKDMNQLEGMALTSSSLIIFSQCYYLAIVHSFTNKKLLFYRLLSLMHFTFVPIDILTFFVSWFSVYLKVTRGMVRTLDIFGTLKLFMVKKFSKNSNLSSAAVDAMFGRKRGEEFVEEDLSNGSNHPAASLPVFSKVLLQLAVLKKQQEETNRKRGDPVS